jgi:hypothetical protein
MKFLNLTTLLIVVILTFSGSLTYNLYQILLNKSRKFNLIKVFVGWFAGIMIFFTLSLVVKEIQQNNYPFIIVSSGSSGIFGFGFFEFMVTKKFMRIMFDRFIFFVTGVDISKKKEENGHKKNKE